MFELEGLPIGSVILESRGPMSGVNYNTNGTGVPVPTTAITVIGTGSVALYGATAAQYVGTTFGEWRPRDSDWSLIQGGIVAGPVPVTINLPVGAIWSFIRVVVDGVGTGKVTVENFIPAK